jgi:hypothetical protein
LTKLEPLLDAVPTVERWLPPVLTRTRVLEVALWQWLALPASAIVRVTGVPAGVRTDPKRFFSDGSCAAVQALR